MGKRSAHQKSTYVLRKLPRCSKCKKEFILVSVCYETKEGTSDLCYEWECQRCKKIVSAELLREEPIPEEDRKLHEWVANNRQRKRAIKPPPTDNN